MQPTNLLEYKQQTNYPPESALKGKQMEENLPCQFLPRLTRTLQMIPGSRQIKSSNTTQTVRMWSTAKSN